MTGDDGPGIVLQVTFEKMSPIMEQLLYYFTIFLLTVLLYLYLIIIDFVTVRAFYIYQRRSETLSYQNLQI